MKHYTPRILAVLVCLILALSGIVLSAPDAEAGKGKGQVKTTICHYPPGNPANVQIITVGNPAVLRGHFRHGDGIYPACALPPGDDDDDDDNPPPPPGDDDDDDDDNPPPPPGDDDDDDNPPPPPGDDDDDDTGDSD